MSRDYAAGLKKTELEDGAYYKGTCRNATEARWHAASNQFFHWRNKFGRHFVEAIKHYEDEQNFDVFNALEKMAIPSESIPFPPKVGDVVKVKHLEFPGEYRVREVFGAHVDLENIDGCFNIGNIEISGDS